MTDEDEVGFEVRILSWFKRCSSERRDMAYSPFRVRK
jgi:hypothetical protein